MLVQHGIINAVTGGRLSSIKTPEKARDNAAQPIERMVKHSESSNYRSEEVGFPRESWIRPMRRC